MKPDDQRARSGTPNYEQLKTQKSINYFLYHCPKEFMMDHDHDKDEDDDKLGHGMHLCIMSLFLKKSSV